MSLLPSFVLDCVVAIGKISTTSVSWMASGFLYGYFTEKKDDKDWYHVYLVTNRHVFDGEKQVRLRFNPLDNERARDYPLSLFDDKGNKLWYSCPDMDKDIAVIKINSHKLRQDGIQFSYFQSDKHVANIQKLQELGISEGDFVYILGFPMGITGGDRNYVIVRNGSIARIRVTLQMVNKSFLIDAFVFPGNSGGPVVSKPELLAIKGTKSQGSAYLIGIVQSYVTYQDIAIIRQTNKPRIIFEENSGLCSVQPIDFIQEAIQEHRKIFEKTDQIGTTSISQVIQERKS